MTARSSQTSALSLYDHYYRWLKHTVRLLHEGNFARLDVPHLIEEIETMGRSEKRELRNRLVILLMHLLKWKYQPIQRSEMWRSAISEQRISLEGVLEDSPSLRPFFTAMFDDCYQRARQQTAYETGLSIESFPETYPFEPSTVQDAGYFPE